MSDVDLLDRIGSESVSLAPLVSAMARRLSGAFQRSSLRMELRPDTSKRRGYVLAPLLPSFAAPRPTHVRTRTSDDSRHGRHAVQSARREVFRCYILLAAAEIRVSAVPSLTVKTWHMSKTASRCPDRKGNQLAEGAR